jgi:1-phosphatidylinositol-3-phosphate 5-kinase
MEESYRSSSLNPITQSSVDTSRITISAPLESRIKPPQSQFAASTLFPRPEALSLPWDVRDDGSRPVTPFDFDPDDFQRSPLLREMSSNSLSRQNASPPSAPFRRHLAEEDKAPATIRPSLKLETSVPSTVIPHETLKQTVLSTADDVVVERTPSPADEADEGNSYRHPDTPGPLASPFLPRFRSRLPSRLTEEHGDADFSFASPSTQDGAGRPRLFSFSQRPRRDSLNPDVDLSAPAMNHVRSMLRQCLEREKIPTPQVWEDRLIDLLSKVAKYPFPNVRNGDKMDVRHYVRIKKIPGGTAKDSEYIDGVVCTKNVLHKQMSRHLVNPRIMLLSFPLEYQRVENQLMSLDPIIKQEREYLRNLVARVVAQSPHIVLVEKNVSRLALEYLVKANVAVAKNVKPSVIWALHRATQADIISSMDKLALEPRLGRCRSFRIQTYVHSMIPGRRKSFMRFEGCSKDMTGTVLLRGSDLDTLKKVKRIMDLMVLVAFSLKLETFLFWDERVAFVPSKVQLPNPEGTGSGEASDEKAVALVAAETPNEHNASEIDRKQMSARISAALRPYLTASISSSPCVIYPPPYPLLRMRDWDARLCELRRLRDEGEALQILREEQQAALLAMSTRQSSSSSESSDTPTTSTIFVTPSTGLTETPSSEPNLSQVSFSPSHAESVEPGSRSVTIAEIAGSSAVREAEVKYADYLKFWELYLSRTTDSLDPSVHQNIMFLETTLSSVTQRPCHGPELRRIDFYNDHDCTLGQYLEDTVNQSTQACPSKGCDSLLLAHYKSYVHGRFRVQVVSEQYPCPVPGMNNRLIMWSYCKMCHNEPTPYMVVSKETWSYSFGKYLELCFYHDGLVNRDPDCEHNAHRDYVRYFAYKNLAVRIHIDEIRLNDVIVPPLHLAVKTDTRMVLKIAEYDSILSKNAAYWE